MKNEKENKTNRHAPQVRERKGAARARICEKRGTTPVPPSCLSARGDVHLSGMGVVSGKGKRKGKKKGKEKKDELDGCVRARGGRRHVRCEGKGRVVKRGVKGRGQRHVAEEARRGTRGRGRTTWESFDASATQSQPWELPKSATSFTHFTHSFVSPLPSPDPPRSTVFPSFLWFPLTASLLSTGTRGLSLAIAPGLSPFLLLRFVSFSLFSFFIC